MSEIVNVACQVCGEKITFEVEDWAKPPTRAFCGEGCYERRNEARTPSPQATMA